MSSTGHLSIRQGKRVKVFLRDGTSFVAKYKQKHARSVEFYEILSVPTVDIKTITIVKEVK